MTPKHFFIISLHVLLLTHITHTFVLLTANIDDINKLARKFVPASVAEQITDFITKINVNDAKNNVNVSEENEKNQQSSQSVSGEDMSKHNYIAISDKLQEHKRTENKKSLNNFQSKHKAFFLNDLLSGLGSHTGIESGPKNYERIVNTKLLSSLATTDSHRYIPSTGSSIIADYEAKLAHIMMAAKGGRKPHNRIRIKPSTLAYESTVGFAEKFGQARNLIPNRSKFTSLSSRERAESKLADTRFPVNERALTSRKEKTEFDQYDYTKYPLRFATKDREAHPKEAQ